MKKKAHYLIVIFVSLSINHVFCQQGKADSTFGINGRVVIDFGNRNASDKIEDIVQQNDGKIVVLGTSVKGQTDPLSRISLGRLNTDGRLDNTFNQTGMTSILTNLLQAESKFIFIQKDNKILAVGRIFTGNTGEHSLVVARFNSDGTLDSSFGNNGIFNYLLEPQKDLEDIQACLLNDDKLLLTYSTFNNIIFKTYLVKIAITGRLDETFGNNGKILVDSTTSQTTMLSISRQGMDKFIIARSTFGTAAIEMELIRFQNNGIIDTTFGSRGHIKNVSNAGYDPALMKIHTNGKIYIIYNGFNINNTFPVTRLNPNGVLDLSFGTNGVAKISANLPGYGPIYPYSAIISKNGKCIVTGSATSTDNTRVKTFLIRYNEDGKPDLTFGTNGFSDIATDAQFHYIHSLIMQNDGKLVLGGWSQSTFSSDANFEVDRIQSELPTLTKDMFSKSHFVIYPNPSNHSINVSLNDKVLSYKLEIFNTFGQQLMASTQLPINIDVLSDGIYFLKIIQGEKNMLEKFVVKH
jgi:uncharacterized delta-60 repeat protein